MEERLRLLAELKDNMSSQLKKINKELKETKRTPGMDQAQKWFTGFSETARGFVKDGGGVAGVMGSIGVGGLTAAASLAVLTRQFKELGDHVFTMKRLGQETGLTIDQVKRWEYVGQAFRVPVEQMDAALKALGDKMVDFRRRRGELFGQMNQIAPEEASTLLGMKDADAQFHEILRWLSTIKDTALRNRWAKEFFGTDDLGAMLTNGLPELEKAIARARSKVAPISPEMQKQSDELAKSIVDLNQAWENFELKTGPAFLTMLTAIVAKASRFFNPDRAAIEKKQREGGARDERERLDERNKGKEGVGEGPSKEGWEAIEKGLAHKTSYRGSGGLLHQASFGGPSSSTGFGLEGTIASGTKIGVLAAFREWAAQTDADKSSVGGGLISASYETGNVGRGGGSIGNGTGGGGDSGAGGGGGGSDNAPDADVINRFTKPDGTAGFNTRGVKNMNPGNIGFGAWAKEHGATGSAGSDTGHGVAVFPSFEAGYKAMGELALSKYGAGAHSMSQLIAGPHGWTPGNMSAAANVARMMGLGANDDAHLDDPKMMSKFRAALSVQELGPAGARYAFNQMGSKFAGGSGNPVDIAKGMLGFGESAAAKSLGHYMHSGEWCADFVNGSLAKAGSSGTKSAMAASFFQWGKHVEPGSAQKGDVMVSGHHVGFAEGPAEMHNGRMMMPMISGNHGHKVSESWEPVGKYEVRRSLVDEARKAREDKDATSNGSIEAHVHIHDGQVRGATAKSSGIVKQPRVQLRRGPTMTEPSISA